MRSHYSRSDLEHLFQLQPRAAQKLIELLPRTAVGSSMMVDREHLAEFLAKVKEMNPREVGAYLEDLRKDPPKPTRQKLRSLGLRDLDPLPISALPENVKMSKGELEVRFHTIEELVASLYTLARVIDSEEQAFAQRYERYRPAPRKPAVNEMQVLYQELEQLETDQTPVM